MVEGWNKVALGTLGTFSQRNTFRPLVRVWVIDGYILTIRRLKLGACRQAPIASYQTAQSMSRL